MEQIEFIKELNFKKDKKKIKIKDNFWWHKGMNKFNWVIKYSTYSLRKGNLIKHTPYQIKGNYFNSKEKYYYYKVKERIILKNCYKYNRQYTYFLKGNKIYRKLKMYKGKVIPSEEEFKKMQLKKKKQQLIRLQKRIFKLKTKVNGNSSHE